MFGELLPEAKLAVLGRELLEGFDAVFSVGTTSVFPYIAEPVVRARRAGAITVVINPGESEVSRIAEYRFRGGAAATLDALWGRLTTG
jgi:NAD-dependent deacetylase